MLDVYELCTAELQEKMLPLRSKFKEMEDTKLEKQQQKVRQEVFSVFDLLYDNLCFILNNIASVCVFLADEEARQNKGSQIWKFLLLWWYVEPFKIYGLHLNTLKNFILNSSSVLVLFWTTMKTISSLLTAYHKILMLSTITLFMHIFVLTFHVLGKNTLRGHKYYVV